MTKSEQAKRSRRKLYKWRTQVRANARLIAFLSDLNRDIKRNIRNEDQYYRYSFPEFLNEPVHD